MQDEESSNMVRMYFRIFSDILINSEKFRLGRDTAQNRFYRKNDDYILEVIKKCPKPFPPFLLFAKLQFSPFDSVPLAVQHFAILRHHIRLI